jgi:hypothetical protein
MKTFLQLVEEDQSKEKHHVMAFGRMNPPTTGHLKLIDKVKEVAHKVGGKHSVILSHSQDTKKNPLSAEQKVKHLKRYSPGTHFVSSSKEKPTLLHHAAELHKQGVTHLHVVGGSDRVKEYHDLLHKYNGKKAGHGEYNFKKITVHSAGHRDPDAEGAEGMSGTKMREHAKNKDFSSFRQGVPSHVADHHAKELMHDVRKGMGLHESVDRGIFKAVFVTGGPGSGKDIIIREAIPHSKMVEMNCVQILEYLMDKQKLSEKTNDFRRESIRNRAPLIINGPADDVQRMTLVKEELEELGYTTAMVFVNTTDDVSKNRNEKLNKTILESVRQDKWKKSQYNKNKYSESFNTFIYLDNNSSVTDLEEEITDTYQKLNMFIEKRIFNDVAISWLENHGKLNINESLNYFLKENQNVEKTSKSIQKANIKGRYNPSFRSEGSGPTLKSGGIGSAPGPGDITPDNRAGDTNDGDIKWNAPRKRGSYIFRTYSESNRSGSKTSTQEEESRFSQDKEKIKVKKKRFSDAPTVNQRMRNTDGVGQEFDTRQQGTVYPMSGLGDVTYREEKNFRSFRNTIKEAIDDPGAYDMGVGGVLGGASNKEPLVTPMDKFGQSGISIKKKKKTENKNDQS